MGKTMAVEPAADLVVPGGRGVPVLPRVLLHPVLGAVHDGRCRRFLDEARSGLSDRGAGGSARFGFCDRCAGELACWWPKGRRRTALGGGIGGGRGGERGGDCDGVAYTDRLLSLTTAPS